MTTAIAVCALIVAAILLFPGASKRSATPTLTFEQALSLLRGEGRRP